MAMETKLSEVEFDDPTIDTQQEAEGLVDCLARGDIEASIHFARVVESDTKEALRPFAQALYARLCDHLIRYAAVGIADPREALENEVYHLIKIAAIDWDENHGPGSRGEAT
jgi:hypothetical protein